MKVLVTFAVAFAMLAGTAFAADTLTDPAALLQIIEEQNATIEELASRVEALEAALTSQQEAVTEVKEEQAKTDWTDKVSLKGDLRYRHELIDQEGKDERNRQRIRARLGITGQINEELTAGFQLASGTDDPVSTNETLSGGFSTKDIKLDRAYVDWALPGAKGINLVAGKMATPFYTPNGSDLMWDGDLNPEGLALKYKNTDDDTTTFGSLAALWGQERSSTADSLLYAGQLGLTKKLNSTDKLTFGGGLYYWTSMENYLPLYDDGDSFGNWTNIDGEYEYGFNIWEVFADYTFKAGEQPVVVYGNYLQNTEADEEDTGWIFGVKYGAAKNIGDWDAEYNYRMLEANAVVGAFCDSDFAGGGTDGKGHKVKFGYQVAKNAKLGLTYFVNELGADGGDDYNRLQLDLETKF